MKKQLILGALALSIAGTTQLQSTKKSLTFNEIAQGVISAGFAYGIQSLANCVSKEQNEYINWRFKRIKRLKETPDKDLGTWDLETKKFIENHPARVHAHTAVNYLIKYMAYALSKGSVPAYFICLGAYLQKHHPAVFQSIAQ